ncbi:hypothetical protein Bhyg_05205 [Pseudolycoriella hygida]|uniref:Uncharacterized protein n=1 Tax=Pseudolycoriella hygida TaxID=35572 RepID=A0A9Q0NH97_9DIPT|nr:hypothetical protein Bhyg_05205 [Pseudolycoriella hygida]
MPVKGINAPPTTDGMATMELYFKLNVVIMKQSSTSDDMRN